MLVYLLFRRRQVERSVFVMTMSRAFYEHFDFIPSLTDPLHLFILTKDLRYLTTD
jgi:hypothetical protein